MGETEEGIWGSGLEDTHKAINKEKIQQLCRRRLLPGRSANVHCAHRPVPQMAPFPSSRDEGPMMRPW